MDSPKRTVRDDLGWLIAIVVLALVIRIYLPWSLVYAGPHVNLLETDAWYHLRVIENLVSQFPFRLTTDPYVFGAPFLKVPPLLDYLVAGVAWMLGLGRPSETLVTTVAVFTPPVLAAGTVVGVYVVARLAAGSVAGLIAAALAATLPGHFLDRTVLGYVDHHALESLVSVVILWLLARAVTQATPVLRSGLWLGLVLCVMRLTWTSAAMLVGILVGWLVLHIALQSWRTGGAGDAARITGIGAAVALLFTIVAPNLEPFGVPLQLASLSVLALVAGAAELGRTGLRSGWWSPLQLVALTVILGGVATLVGLRTFPEIAGTITAELSRFRLTETGTTVLEARPLFMYNGVWSVLPAWQYFRGGFPLGLAALVFLAFRWWRHGRAVDLLILSWTAAMFVATIGVNRFGYYLVPAIAIAGGSACASLLAAGRRGGGWRRDAAVIAVAAGAFGFNLVPALASTQRPAGLPASWLPAFEWLRGHTEEPFGDPDYYYARYTTTPVSAPQSTVMVWWDYGYALMTAGRRVPVAIPTGAGGGTAAQFFTEGDETRALDRLATTRSRYVFMDELLPFHVQDTGDLFGKFQAIAETAGQSPGRYFEVFFVRQDGPPRPVYLFFEDYYRTMAFRLGVLGGEAAAPVQSTDVVSWSIEPVPGFGPARVVSALDTFPTYDAATERLRQLGPGNHAIVGRNPRVSVVPLPPLERFRRVYATPSPGAFGQGAVQIFEVK